MFEFKEDINHSTLLHALHCKAMESARQDDNYTLSLFLRAHGFAKAFVLVTVRKPSTNDLCRMKSCAKLLVTFGGHYHGELTTQEECLRCIQFEYTNSLQVL